MLKESAIDESIKSILIPIIESLKVKDAEIIELKNEVTYLIKKTRWSSTRSFETYHYYLDGQLRRMWLHLSTSNLEFRWDPKTW